MYFRFILESKSDRRFLTSSFFHESVYSGALSFPMGPFRIFMKICGDINNFIFIIRVNDTSDK
jgi:hypothetical protein